MHSRSCSVLCLIALWFDVQIETIGRDTASEAAGYVSKQAYYIVCGPCGGNVVEEEEAGPADPSSNGEGESSDNDMNDDEF